MVRDRKTHGPGNKSGVERFGVSMPPSLLEEFDAYIQSEGYQNRSEAIRDLVRQMIAEKRAESVLKKSTEEAFMVLTIVYDHHKPLLAQKVLDAQHDHTKEIVSTMHIHIDHENCLEIIVVRAKGRDLQNIAGRLSSIKGVRLGRYIILPKHVPE